MQAKSVNSRRLKYFLRNKSIRAYFPFIFLIAMILIFSLNNSRFFTWNNVTIVLVQIVTLLVSAMGATFVIMGGSIDLSIGSILALSAVVTSLLVPEMGIWAFIPAIAVGALCGLINGLLIAIGRVPSFITTMGTVTALRGIVLIITQGTPIPINHQQFLNLFAGRSFFNIPNAAIFVLVIVILSFILMEKTPFGKELRAVGGGERVAELSGIKVNKVKILAYVFAGTMYGIAGLLQVSRVLAATATLGIGFELSVIAAVVVGGTALSGGVGGIKGTILGALIIQVLSNGMNMIGFDAYYQNVVTGVVLIMAVFISVDRKTQKSAK